MEEILEISFIMCHKAALKIKLKTYVSLDEAYKIEFAYIKLFKEELLLVREISVAPFFHFDSDFLFFL